MIDFEPSEEQQLVIETVRAFAEKEVRPRARDCDEAGKLPGELLAAAHELGLVIEVVADDAETSAAILALARSVSLHATYPGRKAIAGNLAFPFSPSDLRAGEVFEFSVHHLVEVDDFHELFPIELVGA